MQQLDAILKTIEWSLLFPRQTIQYHSNPSLCPNKEWWRSWSWTVLWRPTRPFRTNTQKSCTLRYGGLERKSRKTRNTWSNRKIWLWSMKGSRAQANRVFQREHTGHSKHPLPTTQEKTLHMDITSWSTLKSDWLYRLRPKMEKLYTVSKTRLGADCGSDHELLLPNSDLKWRK